MYLFICFNLYSTCGAEEGCICKEWVETPAFLYLHSWFSSAVGVDVTVRVWRAVCFKPGKRDCEQQNMSRVPGQVQHLSLVLTLCDPVRVDVSKFLSFATLCFHHYF